MTLKRCRIIGLTGQSGAGKSSVANLLKQSGIAVIDADEIVGSLYLPNSACLSAVSAVFGVDIVYNDGTLNRKLLAKRAFSSRESTAKLNKIVHPFVIYELLKIIRAEREQGAEVVVYDAPQLFESMSDLICDMIISVVAEKALRLERICNRDGIDRSTALERMSVQLDEKYFRANSDFVIENNGNTEMLAKQTEQAKKLIDLLGRGD